jgi:hypothetical protein
MGRGEPLRPKSALSLLALDTEESTRAGVRTPCPPCPRGMDYGALLSLSHFLVILFIALLACFDYFGESFEQIVDLPALYATNTLTMNSLKRIRAINGASNYPARPHGIHLLK